MWPRTGHIPPKIASSTNCWFVHKLWVCVHEDTSARGHKSARIRIHDVMSGAGLRPAIDGVREYDMVRRWDFETMRLNDHTTRRRWDYEIMSL